MNMINIYFLRKTFDLKLRKGNELINDNNEVLTNNKEKAYKGIQCLIEK